MNFPVLVSFDDGINIRDGQFELNAILLAGLAVTSNPAKTVYRTGERISYSGLAVTAIYTDDSTADVTSICSINPPENTEIDSDITAEISYSEGQDEQSATLQLTHLYLTGLNITHQPDKTMYKTGETISYAGLIVTASYSDGSARVVTDSCSISPAEGKAFDPDTDSQVEISYHDVESAEASFSLTHNSVRSITVSSQPDKTWYRSGENINYTGMVVTATYSDDSTADVTDICTITPRAGKPFDPENDSYVEISFDDNSSAMIQLNELYLTGLSVSSNPEKTAYIKGEYIDYTGLIITASYSDSSSEDVTASCSITPQEGKQFDPDTDTNAEITYSEGSITETAGFMLTEIYMTGLQVTSNPLKTAYKHDEIISYEGLVVTANYSNGTSEDVTSECSITPAEGKTFDADTDTYAEITYSQGDNEANCMLTLTPILLTSLAVTTAPHKFAYVAGEHIDYTGIAVTASYSDKTTAVVTGKCTFSARQGKPFSPDTDTNVTITYAEGQNEMTCSLTLGETSMTLIVSAMPNKTIYQPGEALDLAGLVIKAVHLDGSQHNVTDYCEFPSEINGSEIKVSAKCAITPSPYIFDHRGGYIDNGSWVGDSSSSKYSDIYTVEAGHKYLLAGSSFNAMFTTHDVSKTEGNVAGTAVEVVNSPDGYACAEFTPSFSGYLIASKDSGGLRTYLYDADSQNKNVVTGFALSTAAVTALSVSKPVKTRYRTGETLDLTGAVVTATYSDGTILNVTDKASFSPAHGAVLVSPDPVKVTNSPVTVSYGGISTAFEITMCGVAIMSLSVTPPDKTFYYDNEKLDYTGCTVTAVYWDGRTKDVTDKVTFEPPEGEYPYPETEERYMTYSSDPRVATKYTASNTQVVKITYQELDEQACSNVQTYDYWDNEWQSTDEYAYYYYQVHTDENGNIVFETPDYKDDEGQWHYGTTSYHTRVRYLDLSDGLIKTQTFTIDGISVPMDEGHDGTISVVPGGGGDEDMYYFTVPATSVGGIEERNGQLGWVIIHRVDTYCVIPDINYSYVHKIDYAGETFIPFMTVYYQSSATYELNLSVFGLDRLVISKMPDKAQYRMTEMLDTTGMQVTLYYTDGSSKDVSSSVTIPYFFREYGLGMQSKQELYYDKENSLYNIPVEYSESGVYPGKDTIKGNLVIKIIMLSRLIVTTPQKNSYRYGEALDYTGIAVTAVYTDGSTEDVTSYAVFSPANGTVITKDTANTVSVSYSNRWTGSAQGSFSFSILTLQQELQISLPNKTAYHKGETIDYTGVTVNAVYSDGSTEDITSYAVFSPAEGTVISNDTTTSVSFSNRWDETASGSFSLSIITLNQELQITPPDKTSYHIGEAIDYAGAAVTAVYSDESTEDVTSSATFSPADGTVITEDMNENVSVSYTDQWHENASGSFSLNVITLQSDLQITPPEKTSYRQGEAIDYTGATVTAVYSDGSMVDVTSSAVFSPANGTVITEDMTGSVSVSYTNEWSENASGTLSMSIE